ncbi:MAG TPA: urease accessory protein UreD [Citreicella sp.]|nr:urease accessory protein UreD [Citreicella sp.]
MKDFAGPAPQLSLTCGLAPDGGTQILARHVEWPWSLPRGFRREGSHGPLTVLPQCAGAALLPGDHWRHEVTVQTGGSVDLVSAGALMIHADRRRGRQARADWLLRVEPGARLRHLADPAVLMTGARMRQQIEVVLAAGGRLVLFDGTCRQSPRAAEAGGVWQSDLHVTDPAGRTLLRERQHVTEADLLALAALPGGMTAFGTVLLLGDPEVGRIFPDGPLALDGAYAAAGAARGGAGVVLRIAATTGGALDRAFRQIRARLS